jgi:hypothetical protein
MHAASAALGSGHWDFALNAIPMATTTRMASSDSLILQHSLLSCPKVLFAASRAACHLVLLDLESFQHGLVSQNTREYQLPWIRALNHHFGHSDPPLEVLGPETDRQPRPALLTCA